MTKSNNLLEAALSYAKRGWYIVPLHNTTDGKCSCQNDCGKNAGKHPRLGDWPNQASVDKSVIEKWWRQWPSANIGILTGPRSKLYPLDIDPRNGGDVSLADLQKMYTPLPDTVVALTGGGGSHIYFTCNEYLHSCIIADGIDFPSDNHQIVAPPSIHLSGRQYEWEISSHPDDIPVAEIPDWLVAIIKDKTLSQKKTSTVELPESLPFVDVMDLDLSSRIKNIILMGKDKKDPDRYQSRSEALFAVISAMIEANYSDGEIASVVMDPDNAISDKPLSQKNKRDPRYLAQTKEWVAKEIGRAREKRKEELQPDAMRFISDYLGGLTCKGFYREGRGLSAIYSIVLNGNRVIVGTADQLQEQRRWRSVMIANNLRPMTRKKDDAFCDFIASLLTICQTHESESAPLDGIKEDIDTYLLKAVEYSYWAVENNRPFERGGMFYIHIRAFMQWQNRQGLSRIDRPILMAMLREIGFQQSTVSAREEAKVVTRSYWRR